jgi:rubrerythrin
MPTPTMAGTQSEPHRLIEELIKLDYDAIEAYDAAIERLDDEESKQSLAEFRDDHARHTENLARFLRDAGRKPPSGPDAKRVLTKGKVLIADLMGDKAILQAMKSNEDDTNTVYERATQNKNLSSDMARTVRENLEDERRHRAWLEQKIAHM